MVGGFAVEREGESEREQLGGREWSARGWPSLGFVDTEPEEKCIEPVRSIRKNFAKTP